MTGRKGRLIKDPETGTIRYEARNSNGIALDMQNIHERDAFMKGDKLIAIISEAASAGISLQVRCRTQY